MADDTNDDTSHRYLVFDPAKTVTTLARLLRLTGERFETIYDAGACGHNEEFICVGRVEAIGARTPDVALFDMTWRCFHCGASDALYGQALHDARRRTFVALPAFWNRRRALRLIKQGTPDGSYSRQPDHLPCDQSSQRRQID